MKRMLTLMCVLLVAACSDDKAANPLQGAEQNAPKPVAAQERELAARLAEQKNELDAQTRKMAERADRLKTVEPLLEILSRWTAVRVELSRPNMQLSTQELITRMEALKKETEAAPVDSCSGKGRASLVDSMAQTIAIANQALAKKGQPDPTIQEAVDKAFAAQQQAEAQLSECAQ